MQLKRKLRLGHKYSKGKTVSCTPIIDPVVCREKGGKINRNGRNIMPRKTCKPEEIIGILRDAEIQQEQGRSIADCCRAKVISVAIYYRNF